jgi:hypothetical protein
MAHAHAPLPDDVRSTIDLWVSDSLDRPAVAEAARPWGPDATSVLAAFLEAACHGGTPPGELGEHETSHALLDHVAALEVPHKDRLPGLVAAFVGDLEDQGRLADGHRLATFVRALAPTFRERAAGRSPDLTRQAAKIGRNDPCPCGSGRKYKACCLARLG